MGAYTTLTAAGTTTRAAAGLTGVPRATATRRARQGQAELTRQETTPTRRGGLHPMTGDRLVFIVTCNDAISCAVILRARLDHRH